MSTLYLTEQYAVVKREAEYLVILIPEEHGKHGERRRVEVPLLKIDQVVVSGNVSFTTPALHALLEARAEICFLTERGDFRGRLAPAEGKNGLLRLEQHAAHADPERRLALAKRFVQGKLVNQRTLLLRQNRKLGDDAVAAAGEAIRGALQAAERSSALDVLIGEEGSGSAAYFGVFARLLRQDLGFERRTRRPPTDPVNALLSYGYTILASKVAASVATVGLDPYIGFLHASQYGRTALALDLMEEFRPVIVDSVVLTLINNRELGPESFQEELGAHRMTDAARRTFLQRFEERLATAVTHPVFGYQATYRRCLELQVRLLAKALTGEIPEYVPFQVR